MIKTKNLIQKNKILFSLILLILIISILGTTFAYINFNTKMESEGENKVAIKSSSGSNLEFIISSNYQSNIENTTFNMLELNVDVKYTATTEEETTYDLYYIVNKNNFAKKDIAGKILLKIINPDNTELTELKGYTTSAVGDITGIDITNEIDSINIVENKEICTDSETIQNWKFYVYIEKIDGIYYDAKISNNLVTYKDKIGTNNLETSSQNISEAINEINNNINILNNYYTTQGAKIGNDNLNTTSKTISGAINELNTDMSTINTNLSTTNNNLTSLNNNIKDYLKVSSRSWTQSISGTDTSWGQSIDMPGYTAVMATLVHGFSSTILTNFEIYKLGDGNFQGGGYSRHILNETRNVPFTMYVLWKKNT